MKNLIIYSFLLCVSFNVQSQQNIQLEEASITVPQFEMRSTSDPDEFQYGVTESYINEFTKNPIKFIEKNFNVQDFIAQVKDKKYDSYLITFAYSKGSLKAYYTKDGKLRRTSFKLRNILVPAYIRHEIYKNHKGWTMVKNSYSARGKNNLVDRELYRIKLEKGNKSKIIKINPRRIQSSLYSSN